MLVGEPGGVNGTGRQDEEVRKTKPVSMEQQRGLTKRLHAQPTAFDDALERAQRNGFAPVNGHDDLSPIGVPPLLVTPGLPHQRETVPPQYLHDLLRIADWKPLAHGTASSSIFAPWVSLTGDGSNQRAKASLAFATASASVSPAVAQPGNSGNTADHRFVSLSNFTSRRNFMLRDYLSRVMQARPATRRGNPETHLNLSQPDDPGGGEDPDAGGDSSRRDA